MLTDFVFYIRDHLPEPPHTAVQSSSQNSLRHFSIDTMKINGNMVLWLRVIGGLSPFQSTGHYPILAAYDHHWSREALPLYVAAIEVGYIYYFTWVRDGASSVTYIDELGDSHD